MEDFANKEEFLVRFGVMESAVKWLYHYHNFIKYNNSAFIVSPFLLHLNMTAVAAIAMPIIIINSATPNTAERVIHKPMNEKLKLKFNLGSEN